MKRKTIIIAVVLALISCAYFSLAIVESSSAFPKITITFSKKFSNIVLVNLSDLQINLTDSNGNIYPLVPINASAGDVRSFFEFTTAQPLLNGNYTLYVSASDIVGNKINTTQTLVVDVPYMNIWTSNPPLSVSPKPVFDFVVETAESAFGCKYASSPLTDYFSAPFEFVDKTNTLHAKENFNNASANTDFGLQDGVEKPVYVFCRDSATTRINPKTLSISYDTTPPRISAVAEPQIVTDKIAGKVLSKIKVSSDDKVVCRYSSFIFNETTDSYISTQSNFTQMTNYFGTADDEKNESSYTTNPETTIDFAPFTPNISKIYNFIVNVACINRATFNLADYGAQRVSSTIPVKVTVNLLAPISIVKISPPDFLTNGTIFINVTTNKISTCTYDFNNTSGNLETKDNKVHSKLLSGDFSEGTYTLKINCIGEAVYPGTQTFTIVIDKTPPSAPLVVSPNATCTKQLSAFFSSEDNESGIAAYNYSIVGAGANVSGKFSSSASVTENNLNLSNDSTYYFTAIAINRAGLSSSSGQGNPIRYDATGALCDQKPPFVFIRQNMTPTGVFVSLVCLDSETRCNNNSYSYSVSSDQNCTGIFQPLNYDSEKQIFGVLVSQEGYFCYEASDIAGNTAKGAEKIIFQSASNCFDGLLNGGETDIDCGGSSTCERCGLNKKCIDNTDCISRYCEAGFCKEASCQDNLKNGYETDIDCGGIICPKCQINKSCMFNSDCISNYCNLNQKCDIPTCTDNVTNGNETDVDCGGSCPKCAIGKSCKIDSDCITESCFGNKCFQKPLKPGEQMPAPTKKGMLTKILKILFLMIGVLGIFGGTGYLYYKKHLPPKAAPPKPPLPELKIEKPKVLTPEEKIRKLTIQEQLRREKEEKEKKRKGLFELFGAPKKIPPEKTPKKEEAKPPLVPRKIVPQPKPSEKELLERLEKAGIKKEDIFERLEKLKGETEFEKLEKLAKGKKPEEIEKLMEKLKAKKK